MAEYDGGNKRRKNWQESEVYVLLDLIEPYYERLHGKLNSATSNKDKNDIWMMIARELNREMEDIKRKFVALKSEKLKKYSNYKRVTRGTGGGPPPRDPSPTTMRLVHMMGDNNPKIQGIGTSMDTTQMGAAISEAADEDNGCTSSEEEIRSPPVKKRATKSSTKSNLEDLLIQQNKERHEKEMRLLDIKIENAELKQHLLRHQISRPSDTDYIEL